MSDVQIIITLPEDLAKEAHALGVLSNEHIAMLIRADIQIQLAAMSSDPDIQRELREISTEFSSTDMDGLDQA